MSILYGIKLKTEVYGRGGNWVRDKWEWGNHEEKKLKE